MTKPVRVRFAPSPTGPLHIGGVRTALFNYLFAKKHGGTFILRIEDTDQNRYVEGAEQYIIDALNWCGIPYDEGFNKNEKFSPYRQSERKHLYKQYADQLIASGNAYYAFDASEDLDQHRKQHEEQGKTFIYNWHNRLKLSNSLSLSAEATQAKLDAGDDYVIRFKSPQDETLHLKDIIRGDIQIDTNVLDDKVLFKSDGMPTYHLANIVDDHLMEITHVIRGEEWLPSLALHYQLYDAFGWEKPQFAHLPLILKPTGKGKLSKRDGDKLGFPVFPLLWKDAETGDVSRGYREDGYFSDALINFLAFLGWNPGTEQEIFSLDELIEAFELERVNKSGARFDPEKIKWFNKNYLHNIISNEKLAESFVPIVEQHTSLIIKDNDDKLKYSSRRDYIDSSTFENIDFGYLTRVVMSIKDKASFVNEFWDLSDFFFNRPFEYDIEAVNRHWKEDTSLIIKNLSRFLVSVDFSYENISFDNEISNWINSQNLNFGKIAQPLRLCLTGSSKGPFIFIIMQILGKNETIKRIENAVEAISKIKS